MKVTIDAAALREVMANSTTGRGLLYLEYALFDCEVGKVQVTTTDSVLRSTFSLAAQCSDMHQGQQIEGVGQFTGQVLKLKAALNGLEGEVVLEHICEHLTLQQGRRRYHIPSIKADEFADPELTRTPLDVDGKALAEAVGHVKHFADKDNAIHPMLNGINITPILVRAANRNCIAVMPIETGLPDGLEINIPTTSISRVLMALDKAQTISVMGEKNHPSALEICAPGYVLRTQLLYGKYPASQKLLEPDACKHKAVINTAQATAMLARLMPFAEQRLEKGSSFWVDLKVDDGNLYAAAHHDTESTDFIPCPDAPAELNACMHGQYLADVLHAANGANIEWHFNDNKTIQVFTVEGRDDIHCVMPVIR